MQKASKNFKKGAVLLGLAVLIFTGIARVSAATFIWKASSTGNWGDKNNWSVTGYDSDGIPDSTDDVYFENVGTGNSNVDGNYSVRYISMTTGYSGVLTFGSHTITCGGFNIAAASNSNMNATNGKLVWVGLGKGTRVDNFSTADLYDLEINDTSGNGYYNFANTNELNIKHNFTMTKGGVIWGSPVGDFNVSGDVLVKSTWHSNSLDYAQIKLVGSTDQHIAGTGTYFYMTVAKTGGKVLCDNNINFGNSGILYGDGTIQSKGGHLIMLDISRWGFKGTVDTLEFNSGNSTVVLLNENLNVTGNLILTTIGSLYPNGVKYLYASGDVTVNAVYNASNKSAGPLQLTGTGDQTIYGSAQLLYLYIVKPSGKVIFKNKNKSFSGFSVLASGVWNMNGDTIACSTNITCAGTIAGTGTLSGNLVVNSGGTVSPGGANNNGCITVNGNVTFNSGSTFAVDFDNGSACTNYDQLTVNGNVTINSATFAVGTGNPNLANSVTLINNKGSNNISGTFTNAADNTSVTFGSNSYKLRYNNNNNNLEIRPTSYTPIAKCQPVTVKGCSVSVSARSFDNGSYDADKDSLTYSIGNTTTFTPGKYNITLTVSNSGGKSASCTNTLMVLAPALTLKGNNVAIPAGNTNTSATDSTDFGSVDGHSSLTRSFTIANTGKSALNISSIKFSGADSALFSLVNAAPTKVDTSASTTIKVKFKPNAAIGAKTTKVVIVSDDCANAKYSFTVKATSNASGINTINENNLGVKLYPNPTNNVLNIEWNNAGRDMTSIKIMDLQGKLMLETKAEGAGNQQKQLDLQALPSGLYLLQIQNNNGLNTTRFYKN